MIPKKGELYIQKNGNRLTRIILITGHKKAIYYNTFMKRFYTQNTGSINWSDIQKFINNSKKVEKQCPKIHKNGKSK